MDFKKLSKKDDPLAVFPELADLPAWGLKLDIYLEFLRNEKEPLPETPKDLEGEALIEWHDEAVANQGPLYDFVPQADEVRRYMLFCYAKSSPHARLTDMEQRRQKALDSAGADKRDRNKTTWRFFLDLTRDEAADMLNELMRETCDLIYNRRLSNCMAYENLCIELRSPARYMDEEKKTAAYERKIKISAALPVLEKSIAEDGVFLFGTTATIVDAATQAALSDKGAFQGGWAEMNSTNVG